MNNKLVVLFSLLITFLYLKNLETIPFGLFCDEAIIGITSHELVSGNFDSISPPFFYKHFNYVLGLLPVLSQLPFTILFGTNHLAARLAPSIYFLVSFIIINKTMQNMGVKNSHLATIIYALTPLTIHISRLNFGHAPSHLCIAIGIYFFYSSRIKNKILQYTLSGIFFGLSTYGYGVYILIAPFFLFCKIIVDLAHRKNHPNQVIYTLLTAFILLLMVVPIVRGIIDNPNQARRIKDKLESTNSYVSERMVSVINNYPKYYSPNYLFLTGESGKDPVIRHSIIGKGILLTSSTLIIFSAIIGAFLYKKNNDKLLPFLLMIFLYPFTDVIFTKDGKDPYSFAVFAGLFFLPYLFGFGLDYLGRLSLFKNTRATAHIKISFLLIFVTIVSVIEGLHFYLYTYERYPLISSGYWGWQSGPREMVSFYIQNKSGYDEFIMSNQFNESESLLKFYLIDNPELMSNAKIGSVDNYNPTKKQLFGLSSQQFIEEVKDKYNTEIEEVIYYPNFEPSFYLFTVNEPFLTI